MVTSNKSQSAFSLIGALAYFFFVILGISELASLPVILLDYEPLIWLYFPFLLVGIPALGVVSVIFAAIRQFYGFEIKLLILLIVTLTYFVLLYLEFAERFQFNELKVTAVFSIPTLSLSVWYFVFDFKTVNTSS